MGKDYIVFSDLHMHEQAGYQTRGGVNIMVWVAQNVLAAIGKYAEERGVDTVFHGGDLLHIKNRPPVRLLWNVQAAFLDWLHRGIRNIYLLRGTHDGYGDDFNGVLYGGVMPGVVAVLEPTMVAAARSGLHHDVHMVPYGTLEEVRTAVLKYTEGKPKGNPEGVLLVHYGLTGAKIADYEVSTIPTLPVTDLRAYKYVLAGHYHQMQEVEKNMWQIGSPYRVTFAEAREPKGFWHVTSKGPQFVELNVPDMLEMEGSVSVVEVGLNKLARDNGERDCFLKVTIRDVTVNLRRLQWLDIKDRVMEKNSNVLGMRHEIEVVAGEGEIPRVREARFKNIQDFEGMVRAYVRDNAAALGQLDSDKAVKVGLELLGLEKE